MGSEEIKAVDDDYQPLKDAGCVSLQTMHIMTGMCFRQIWHIPEQ
jgi:hypothetical protein